MNGRPVGLAAIDHRDDVRMRELRDDARLAPEPLDVLVVLEVALVEDLQRDVALEQRVVRLVDARHAAAPEELARPRSDLRSTRTTGEGVPRLARG